MAKSSLINRREGSTPLNVLGTQVRFLCEAPATDGAFSMMEVILPPGGGPPPHHHDWDEAYYVAEGEVRFTLGDKTTVVVGGDFVYAPAGVIHGFQGVSATPARVLILDAPAHATAFFLELDREVRTMPADAPKIPAIGTRHGVHFLPPPNP